MPPPRPRVIQQCKRHIAPRLGNRLRQRPSIQQGHVRTLPQLRAGAVGCVTDIGDAVTIGAHQGAVCITGGSHLVGIGDLIHEGCELGPQSDGLVLPCL